jgi:hypothetical protein
MDDIWLKDDPEEMKKAREASWLCTLFQEAKLPVEAKAKIIRELIAEFKQRKEEIA